MRGSFIERRRIGEWRLLCSDAKTSMTEPSGKSSNERRRLRMGTLDTVEHIESTATLTELYALLEQTFQAFNFEHFIISGIPMPHEQLDRAVVLRNWPAEWFDMYARADFVRVDPTVRMCRATTRPFEWSDAPVDEKDSRGRDVMNFSRDFGLLRGFTLPVHGVDGSEACVSIGGRAPHLDNSTKPALHLLAMYAFERARSFVVPPTSLIDSNPLTQREREVLTWAAIGKSHNEIAEILSITERTVTAHSVNAAIKLGAANKTQAVVKAMQSRFIRI